MKIEYKLANGKMIEIEVSKDVGEFYLESLKEEESNNRANSRSERHTQLSTFTWESAEFFDAGIDLHHDLAEAERIRKALSELTERQQYLIFKCFFEGWSYTDLAALEGKDESAIRHAVNRAKKKL
ncbi:MAG: hypothetical protein GX963_00680, partial [Bacteroidales bacterium]|nr:hypothetical protein [Bacteroidales bacterium]